MATQTYGFNDLTRVTAWAFAVWPLPAGPVATTGTVDSFARRTLFELWFHRHDNRITGSRRTSPAVVEVRVVPVRTGYSTLEVMGEADFATTVRVAAFNQHLAGSQAGPADALFVAGDTRIPDGFRHQPFAILENIRVLCRTLATEQACDHEDNPTMMSNVVHVCFGPPQRQRGS